MRLVTADIRTHRHIYMCNPDTCCLRIAACAPSLADIDAVFQRIGSIRLQSDCCRESAG